MFRSQVKGWTWKWPRMFISLMIFELGATIIALALFSIAQPNLFRTKLWQVGYDHGLNSSPAQILYAYANHRPLPRIPFVWTETLTELNVAVSVLSMFILIVKFILFVLNIWFPILGTVISAFTGALWITSMYGQMGPDFNDPKHPSQIAWYIRKSCDIARPSGNYHYCVLAKITFADTTLMSIISILYTALGIYSTVPSLKKSPTPENSIEEGLGNLSINAVNRNQANLGRELELTSLSNPQYTPITPRTLAFNTLDRRIPAIR
ncbi:hypothetical protein OnM2_075006b [Erysiphe neolycopersici]|uniref:Uncharacterized protein n=1 Tax=Erysiphe neolycopersici TaxID=212602 RepID=A0A420HIW2_9PEZI|nr:hypothetical protein OnM2_075006b [Erysiphe neolycopersici]